ncbi:MAG TPA: apolipoprotein N-acyltransferase [Actinomycetota bacterium]|nr:apolipoprotein N-acyltransferase [Actinomycetota bacterium]
MPELLPRQEQEPARRSEADALQGLRVASAPVRLPVALPAAALSGLLLWFGFAPIDLGPVAFVALVPLLWAARGARARRGALLGLTFGAVYFGALMSWLLPLTILGWSILLLGSAGWTALLVGAAAAVGREERPIRTALAIGAVWVSVEWLRGVMPFGGFTWGALGATQHDNPLLLPLASVAGSWGISFVVAAVNALVLEALVRVRGGWGRPARLLAIAAALALIPAVIPISVPDGPPIEVAVVQGNVPRSVATEDRLIVDRLVAENHARLHRTLAGDPPALVVWPENALDQDPRRDPSLAALVEGAIASVGSPTLVGAITTEDDGALRNENLLYTGQGELVGRYVKNHLVPFGEYVPFRERLEGLVPDIDRVREDLTPGTEPGRFPVPGAAGASFASVICFENAFPDLVRQWVTADMGFLVVSTNNSTFGLGPAARQHLALSEMRAVENGRWVVHGALTGISGIVDPSGRVLQRTALFEPAILRASIPQAEGRTVFNVIGGWLPAAFVLGASLALVAPRQPRRRVVDPLVASPRVCVVLPTYDEAATIEEVARGVLAVGERVEVLVVDDASPDGTADIVRGLGEGRVRLVEREGKRGLARAYLDGFRLALDEGYDLVVEMDADLSHRSEDLRALLAGARSHHLTIGSRYVPGGSIPDWGLGRRILSRGGNLYARILLGLPVADATSGFRVYRADALRELIDPPPTADGYAFQIELAYRAWRLGLSVGEVPITFRDRTHGRSKLSRRIVAEALWKVLAWGGRDRLLLRRSPAA